MILQRNQTLQFPVRVQEKIKMEDMQNASLANLIGRPDPRHVRKSLPAYALPSEIREPDEDEDGFELDTPEPTVKEREAEITLSLNQLLLRIERTAEAAVAKAIREGRNTEKSARLLNDALENSRKSSPEHRAMLEAEILRQNNEILQGQLEIKRLRRAIDLMQGDDGMKRFYAAQGREMGDLAEEAFDLASITTKLPEGRINPETGRRLYAWLQSTATVLGEYADNCNAYAGE